VVVQRCAVATHGNGGRDWGVLRIRGVEPSVRQDGERGRRAGPYLSVATVTRSPQAATPGLCVPVLGLGSSTPFPCGLRGPERERGPSGWGSSRCSSAPYLWRELGISESEFLILTSQ